MARIGWQLAARTNQQHVHGLAQAGKLPLVVENNGLNAGAFGYETEQPRLAAARIRLNEKSGVNQCGQVTFELPIVDNLSDDHRLIRASQLISRPPASAVDATWGSIKAYPL